jgi:solute carrier family 25 carnitine/acylcarnitine transporter 20/29
MGKRLVYSAQSNRDSSPLTIPELACAGAFSAVPATLVAGPAERVKVLLQVSLVQACRRCA